MVVVVVVGCQSHVHPDDGDDGDDAWWHEQESDWT